MLVRRLLVQANIIDNDVFIADVIGATLPGVSACTIRENNLDDSSILVILDGHLLNWEEKQRWLKSSLNKNFWLRVTGEIEIGGYVDGFHERTASTEYKPSIKHFINLIAVEILSQHDLERTTN